MIVVGVNMEPSMSDGDRWYFVRCRPPLALTDGSGRSADGLTTSQYGDLKFFLKRYYDGLYGVIEPLPTGVGHATTFDKLGNKRHKPESTPPPRAAEPDEPDWLAVRLAQAVEALPIRTQCILRWRLYEGHSREWCAEQVGMSLDWVKSLWGPLVTRLYYRAHGLCE